MAANSSIVLTALDFDSYKESLKSYLRSQDRFKDYDFNNSNMSVLLDLLSHNTYLNAFYLNMVASEMFLDSAQLRDSVISHAKELNYLPRSFTSAVATVNITIDAGPNNTKNAIMIPKGTQFLARVGDTAFTFNTAEDVVTTVSNGRFFTATGVNIYEGIYSSDTYAVDYNEQLIYKINSNQVDLSSIVVRVVENNGTDIQQYVRATSMFGIDETSKVFFVQPSLNGEYEVVFGDGVIGRRPLNNSVVIIEYRTCKGELPNGAGKFFPAGRIDNEPNISITTTSPASGGSVGESLNSIKYNAPRAFTTQERAVTAEDYENILKLNFPAEINAVAAYGGEDATPPQYGRVFISIDLKDVDGLPKIKENEYKRFLRSRSSVAMEPIFISPDYIYLKVNSLIKYNINTTGRNPEDIRTLVTRSILQHSLDNLNSFNRTLRYSKLVKDIDASEASVISNETDIELIKYLTPVLNRPQNFTIDFKMPLIESVPLLGDDHPIIDIHAISSTPFTYESINNCVLEDNGDGIIRIVTPVGANHKTILPKAGTVDYDTGVVRINNFKISQFVGTSLKVYAIPRNKDVTSVQNVILNVLEPDITLTIEQIRE